MPKPVLQGAEAISALDQCRQFLGTLAPKDGSRELWIKQGNKIFYRAQWHPDGSLTGIETHLTNEKDTGSRVDKGKPITNLFERLTQRCQREDGGVFYIPTQPLGLPTVDSVDSTDDIGIEIDHMPTTAEQVLLYQKFTEVTGLEFASILTSGGTSVHAHLKLDHHAEISGMTYWRRLATIAFGSDPVTVRPAQAMRMPGFYRREKGAYQELLSTSEARHGFAALTEGFRAWFKHNGWSCPRDIGDQWWREVWQPMLRNTTLSAATRATLTTQYLTEGETAYLERRRAESAARERPAMPANGDLREALRVANDRATVGDFEGVDWDGHGSHARGQCPFHQGKTGNSAWLSDQSGALKFHCVGCTDDEPRDLFEYWCARQGLSYIGDSNPLKGREWAESARGFLGWPDLPKKTTNAEVGKPNTLAPETIESEFAGVAANLRPRIHYRPGRLTEIRREVIDYLSRETDCLSRIYVQGGDEQWLARVLTTGKNVGCCERLSLDKLNQVLNDKFEFYVETADKQKVTNCNSEVTKNIYNASRWTGMPFLKGIIKLPVLRLDGSVTMQPGYDAESGYLLDFNPRKFNLKAEPTIDDAINALADLRELIDECAFADSKSRSGALAMLLTAVSRSAYDFAPLFAITANTPGAGKGALTQVATILAAGKLSSGMTTFHPEEVEFKKSLISTLQSGSPVVSFDNIDRRHEFGGADLETALTNTEFTGRMLGGNANGSFSTRVLFLANGNRLRLSLDMSRRVILITLDAKEENILDKTYSRDMVSHAMANRGRYVSACLTILQAYLLAKPQVDARPLNGYLQWSNLVRNALLWLGEADPVPTSEDIFSLDGIEDRRIELGALIEAWHEVFQTTEVTARTVVETARGIPGVPGATGHSGLLEALNDAAKDLKTGQVTAKALGYYLGANKGTRVGNKRIVKAKAKDRSGVTWQIELLA
jgi:putative DNA primase/helicase